MVSYCIVAVLALLVGAQAETQPCSKQMELEHRCLITVESSPEATMVKDRMKQAMKTCAPDYPVECHAQMEAAHDCAMSIAKNADSDQMFIESKAKSQPAVDQCFAKYPPDVKKGIMEIFMMMKPPHPPPHHRQWKHHNDTENASGENASGENASGENASGEGASGEDNSTSSFERRHHGGGGRGGGGRGGGGRGGRGGRGRHCHHHGRHHGPRNFTGSGSSESNETSASHEKMGMMHGGDPKCQKTPEQHKCMKQELKKLGNDTEFVSVMNTLLRQKKKCKLTVDWSCEAKCPKKKKCIFQATKPCREAFMTRMKTCMEQKGFTLPPFMMHGEQGTSAFTTPLPVLQPLH